jgi:hypothetical protein
MTVEWRLMCRGLKSGADYARAEHYALAVIMSSDQLQSLPLINL